MDCQKHLFSLDEQVTYLNCAYMSPMLKSVEQTGIEALFQKRSPNKIGVDDFFSPPEKLRQEFAKLINCADPTRCAIIPSASYGIATAAQNIQLKKGDEIIVLEEQFPSNYYTWARKSEESGAVITTIKPTRGQPRGQSWNNNILKAISTKTKVVAVPHTHWADGTKFDLVAIRKAANAVGAYLIIDGTQSVGALPFDVQEIQPDALLCAGYKWLMGPYAIGMAYYGEKFQNGVPLEENWKTRYDSQNFANLVNYENRYMPGSMRYDMGEHSSFNLVPMLLKAIEQLNEWTPEAIQKYCAEISKDAIEELTGKGFQIEDAAYRGAHLFGIRMPAKNPEDVKKALEAENVFVSIRGDAVRVSPHVYNTKEDVQKLVECLSR